MINSRFTEIQIVGILKEVESGLPMADLLRSHRNNTNGKNKAKSTVSSTHDHH